MKNIIVALLAFGSVSAHATSDLNATLTHLTCRAKEGNRAIQMNYSAESGVNVRVFKYSSISFYGLQKWWFNHFERESNLEAYQQKQAQPKKIVNFAPDQITTTAASVEATSAEHTLYVDQANQLITLDGKSLPIESCIQ